MVRRRMKHLGQEKAIELMMWNNSDPYFSQNNLFFFFFFWVSKSELLSCLGDASFRANTGKGFTRADLVTQLEMFKVLYELLSHLDDFVSIKTGMQDESAGLVVSVVDPRPGDTIVDCCAAPGGKTLFMASQLSGQAELHEVDNVVNTVHADLRTFAGENCVKSDKVLLDTPCSGLGVLSKRADLRWNRRLEDMKEHKHLQYELLDAASITCSIDPYENEERVDAFLQRHPEFYVDPADRCTFQFVIENGFYSSNPVEHSLDGAFAARLLRSR
ncbi:probable 28S rRNA (cytosine-C(5))-methyltransferase isoform X1 [Olea europaea subsp. europaea]|uniref:Probable 28S rRNA (Cytosine-C(5))-methyltransferase isoform X1 n=1 Tax=Olea europaea subsp. europaea TaxID=158383 RepID=A0A8S0RKZ4_OLEEU|nr:probable 28S rRNA (cytosine-C(5))-methyltransferase isoform X1 [Olea europaea subsp. europaea]